MKMLILTSLLAMGTMVFANNGSPWVTELSSIGHPGSDSLEVTIPLGSHVAVAVYDTQTVIPKPPPEVEVMVRMMWFEHRTVFAGMPEERWAAIPYYLPTPKDGSPTGVWVLELEPTKTGVYQIPIETSNAQGDSKVGVTLTCIELPLSKIAYGLYADGQRYPDREPDYFRDMARHGMNTVGLYAYKIPAKGDVPAKDYAEATSWYIDTAIDQGLADLSIPLICLVVPPWDVAEARKYAKHDKWPELIGYNIDEPPLTMKDKLAEYAKEWQSRGFRTGTAIDGLTAAEIGDPLDVWILGVTSLTPAALALAKERNKGPWVYNSYIRGSNAPLHRYYTGVYVWALEAKGCLTWAYSHDPESHIMPDGVWHINQIYDVSTFDRDGHPIPTVALEGMSDGIIDSRLLQDLERMNTPEGNAYLEELRKKVDVGFWPLGRNREYSKYVWDIPDMAVPPIDMVQMRKEVLRLRKEGRRPDDS